MTCLSHRVNTRLVLLPSQQMVPFIYNALCVLFQPLRSFASLALFIFMAWRLIASVQGNIGISALARSALIAGLSGQLTCGGKHRLSPAFLSFKIRLDDLS